MQGVGTVALAANNKFGFSQNTGRAALKGLG